MCLCPGEYEYYHYLQPTGTGRTDKYDDNGWGCAYRSLQSIISWSRLQRYTSHLPTSSRESHSLLRNRFRLQRYTSHPNPSHYQIQKTLVDHCGQEADGLLGKKTWLGSQAIAAPPLPPTVPEATLPYPTVPEPTRRTSASTSSTPSACSAASSAARRGTRRRRDDPRLPEIAREVTPRLLRAGTTSPRTRGSWRTASSPRRAGCERRLFTAASCEQAHHFESQGTPVMIGGGELRLHPPRRRLQ